MFQKTRAKKLFIFLPAISWILFFSLIPLVPSIAKGNIGEKCDNTTELFTSACTVGECEESSLGPAYCVCNNDSDCAKIYGGSEYEWECQNGDTTSFGLNYCLNEKTSEPKFPIGGNKDASLLDHALNPEAAIGANEITDLIKKPQPKINVPGLSFTDPENIQTVEEEGNKYIIIPYLGEFISLAYIYIIAAIGIAATVMMIDGGLIYIMSKGDSEKINHSKQKISRSVIALLLAVFSYTLLNGLNPELVRLRSLKILTVKGIPIGDVLDNEYGDESGIPTGASTYTGEVPEGEVPFFYQCNPTWKEFPYGPKTICRAGCGVTSYAMLLNYYKNQLNPSGQNGTALPPTTTITPQTIAQWIKENNIQDKNFVGTSGPTMKAIASAYGLSNTTLPLKNQKNVQTINQALAYGYPMIAFVYNKNRPKTPSTCKFTKAGHYIVLTGYDKANQIYGVHDPATKYGKEKKRNFATPGELINDCDATVYFIKP